VEYKLPLSLNEKYANMQVISSVLRDNLWLGKQGGFNDNMEKQ